MHHIPTSANKKVKDSLCKTTIDQAKFSLQNKVAWDCQKATDTTNSIVDIMIRL